MKILQVAHSFPPHNFAGTEIYTYDLSKELSKAHQVSIFHRINNPPQQEYTLTRSRLDNLDIFTINNTHKLCHSFRMTYENDAITERFAQVLEQVHPDIVHIQHLLFLSVGIIKKVKKRGLPLIFTLHDYWLICHQGQLLNRNLQICAAPDTEECRGCLMYQLGIKPGIMHIYQFLKRNVPYPILQRLKEAYLACAHAWFLSKDTQIDYIRQREDTVKEMLSLVDRFIAPSQFLKQRFVDFGVADNKIVVSPYGLNLRRLAARDKKKTGYIRFGFIGTLLPAKGVHVLLAAFNRLKGSAGLQIFGRECKYTGFEDYPRILRRLAGNNENIQFMGEFKNRDIANALAQIDVLTVPSIWQENLPLVIQEAFAAATPVLAAKIGGIPELIKEGINGFLFQPDDVDGLHRKMELIIENPALIEQMRQNINLPKSIAQNAKEIEDIYQTQLELVSLFSVTLLTLFTILFVNGYGFT